MPSARQTIARRSERGASLVEFAIVAPLFFFLLFAIIELCVLFCVNLTMQYAVREGARYAVTGRNDLDPDPSHPQRTRAVIENIKEASMGFYDYVEPRINGISYSDPTHFGATMFGAPGEIIVLRLDCTWTLITPFLYPFFDDGKYRFSVAATMRNEAF